MKKEFAIALLGVFVMMGIGIVLAPVPAVAQHPGEEGEKGFITIDHPAEIWPPAKLDKKTGAKKKTPVTFSHGNHGKRLGCPSCHHKQPDLKPGSDIKVTSCFGNAANCHGPADMQTADGKTKPNTWKIIHAPKIGRCRECHKSDPAAIEAKAPVKCKGCHPKKA